MYIIESCIRGHWLRSALYTPSNSISDVFGQASDISNDDAITRRTRERFYRIIDDDTKEVITEFSHDNLWMLERLL